MSESSFRSALQPLARYATLLLLCLLQACATPTNKLDELAQSQGFERSELLAEGYRLLVYDNARARSDARARRSSADSAILHVYLEGDGSPWTHRTIVMADPTPRRPLMLRLMKLDREAAVYLGRPCYNGTSSDDGCDSSLWTSGRYSRTVIDSMASGLRVLAHRYGASELWLMGHSGGGALAMLLARENPMVTRVVTIAGNLNTRAWTAHHGYTPLYSSINPADLPPIRDEVWQWHFLGGQDAVIPPPLVRRFIMQQPQASGFLMKQFSHGCCWHLLWPRMLKALEQDDPGLITGAQFKYRDTLLDASDSR
ncbi:alpha/beta fold hydrolase [Granulosicoccus sp. 3-233]|uniref:alpha/beta fold hydrolase n=1 Tax=Granulosicoccus sp. 3-233 TaxID=3417969 RepID=UPI003D33AF1E